jgi:hypothetical protein
MELLAKRYQCQRKLSVPLKLWILWMDRQKKGRVKGFLETIDDPENAALLESAISMSVPGEPLFGLSFSGKNSVVGRLELALDYLNNSNESDHPHFELVDMNHLERAEIQLEILTRLRIIKLVSVSHRDLWKTERILRQSLNEIPTGFGRPGFSVYQCRLNLPGGIGTLLAICGPRSSFITSLVSSIKDSFVSDLDFIGHIRASEIDSMLSSSWSPLVDSFDPIGNIRNLVEKCDGRKYLEWCIQPEWTTLGKKHPPTDRIYDTEEDLYYLYTELFQDFDV